MSTTTSTAVPSSAAPADGTSIDAAPDGVPEHTALTLAKVRLIEAARLIDPLKPIREHPFVTVGVAGGAGAVLGSTGGAAVAFSSLVHSFSALLRSLTGLAGPLASMIGPMLAGKFADHSPGDATPADPTPAADA